MELTKKKTKDIKKKCKKSQPNSLINIQSTRHTCDPDYELPLIDFILLYDKNTKKKLMNKNLTLYGRLGKIFFKKQLKKKV